MMRTIVATMTVGHHRVGGQEVTTIETDHTPQEIGRAEVEVEAEDEHLRKTDLPAEEDQARRF
jgi:hypothetical protein